MRQKFRRVAEDELPAGIRIRRDVEKAAQEAPEQLALVVDQSWPELLENTACVVREERRVEEEVTEELLVVDVECLAVGAPAVDAALAQPGECEETNCPMPGWELILSLEP